MKDQDWDDRLDDEIWFIVDTDSWKNQLHELSQICDATKNWFIANSNPCFEVWLFYHISCVRIKEDNPQRMKRLLGELTPGGYNLNTYISKMNDAIACAGEIDQHKTNSIADVGVSKVYKLAAKILELLPKEDGIPTI